MRRQENLTVSRSARERLSARRGRVWPIHSAVCGVIPLVVWLACISARPGLAADAEPPRPAAGERKPEAGNKPEPRPAPPGAGRGRIECKFVMVAPDDSLHLDIIVEIESLGFRVKERVSRESKAAFTRGAKKIIDAFREEIPDLILKAFVESQGERARFVVSFHTRGDMCPPAAW